MQKSENMRVYMAEDIAEILVRNPDQIVDLLTYERICEIYGQGRALDDMPEHEKLAMVSLEAAIEDLTNLGFNEYQISTMIGALHDSFVEINIRGIAPDMKDYTFEKQMIANAFGVVAFPYGPPIVIHSPHYALKSHGHSASATRNIMNRLTRRLACKLMEKRLHMPDLLTGYPDLSYQLTHGELDPISAHHIV